MLLPLVALTLLAAGEEPSLPPGHPPLPAAQAPGAMPPDHPPLAGASGGGDARSMPAGHPPLAGAPDAAELMKKLEEVKDLEDRPKTFEIASSIGRLYYAGARYAEASKYLAQALEKAEPARKFFLEQRKKAQAAKKQLPAPEAVGCAPGPEQTLDGLLKKAQEKAQANDPAAAAMCARVALVPAIDAGMMRGRALFLSGDAKAAVAEFSRVLEINEGDGDAQFARGNALLDSMGDDVKSLKVAKQDLAAVAQSAVNKPRAARAKALVAQVDAAIAAGGVAKLNEKKAAERKAHPVQVAAARPPMANMPANAPFANAGGANGANPPQLTQEMVDAVKNTEMTPEVVQGLAKLVDEAEEHLAHGRFQEALDNYKRVVPFQPENGRAKAGMAWALVGLNKQPMADRIWGVAVNSDAKAVDSLGDALKAKGDANGAKALWTKLAGTAPGYAQSAGLAAKIQ